MVKAYSGYGEFRTVVSNFARPLSLGGEASRLAMLALTRPSREASLDDLRRTEEQNLADQVGKRIAHQMAEIIVPPEEQPAVQAERV